MGVSIHHNRCSGRISKIDFYCPILGNSIRACPSRAGWTGEAPVAPSYSHALPAGIQISHDDVKHLPGLARLALGNCRRGAVLAVIDRKSEEHTSELQSLR